MQSAPFFKRRLGRGLNALLGGAGEEPAVYAEPADAVEPATMLADVHVEHIDRNPFQPRRDFDDASLGELAESIRQHGVLQPLIVRVLPQAASQGVERYQLIAGERRWLAARQAGLEHVPCRVLELEDRQVCEVAIEENLKRKDLNVLEKAQAFKSYIERFASSIEELAARLSLNRSTVSNYLRLLELCEPVREALASDRITSGHARSLLPLNEADQIAVCRRIESESLSVRATEQIVRELLESQPEPAAGCDSPDTVPFESAQPSPGADSGPTAHVLSLQEQLRSLLGLRVEIHVRGKDAGRVVIPFASNDEFERIVGHLRRAA